MRPADLAKTMKARRLRADSTNAELRLWNRLRSRGVEGCKFVRQEPIGKYVVDFVCRERRLVIEVDGGQHADSDLDKIRDAWLRQHSYKILRFWNNDVLNNTSGVLEVIVETLRAESPPHPTASGGRPLPASGER